MGSFQQNAFLIRKCRGDNGAVANVLQQIEVGVCTQHVHLTDVVFDILCISLNLPCVIFRKHMLEEIVAMAYLTKVPRIAAPHLVLSGYPANRAVRRGLVVRTVVVGKGADTVRTGLNTIEVVEIDAVGSKVCLSVKVFTWGDAIFWFMVQIVITAG